MKLTLPADSAVRKDIPLYSGCYSYFPAALAGVAMHSKAGNDKHNPGEPLHHARGKSMDHADCIARHSMDLADMQADFERRAHVLSKAEKDAILIEADALCWRSLAWSQELHERFNDAPLAPAARLLGVERKQDTISRAILDQRPEWAERKPDFLGRTFVTMDTPLPESLQGYTTMLPPCPVAGCVAPSGHGSPLHTDACGQPFLWDLDTRERCQRLAGQPTAAEANQACAELVSLATRSGSSESGPTLPRSDQTRAQDRVCDPAPYPTSASAVPGYAGDPP